MTGFVVVVVVAVVSMGSCEGEAYFVFKVYMFLETEREMERAGTKQGRSSNCNYDENVQMAFGVASGTTGRR